MKTNKVKNQKKAIEKAVKKKLEQTLSERLAEAVKSLGHNAENIADDIIYIPKTLEILFKFSAGGTALFSS